MFAGVAGHSYIRSLPYRGFSPYAADSLEPVSLKQLRAQSLEVFRHGGGSRPDVLLINFGEGRAVLKDHNACDPFFARVLGPVLAWREARALRRLDSVSAVPSLLARPDARSLLLEYLPGQPLHRTSATVDWQRFFERLEQLVKEIHSHGVAHCDLRSPGNTLVAADESPVVVDFVAAVLKGAPWNVPARWVYKRFAQADEEAIAKLKHHVAPELLTAEDGYLLEQRSWLERAARWVGAGIRDLSRRLFTRDAR